MRLKVLVMSGAMMATLSAIAPDVLAPFNPVAVANAQNVSISFSTFYDGLNDDGDWVNYGGNYVFVPADVRDDWRPYTQGHWVHARGYGWVWISNERFGWATYHYGRWGYADDIGWYWLPGTRWAPAWVSWRRSGSHVAWAPLPPQAYENDDFSVNININLSSVPYDYWVAVPTRSFLDVDLGRSIVRDDRENQRIYDNSKYVGSVTIQNNTIINNVINVQNVQKSTGQQVQDVKVTATNNPAAGKANPETVVVFKGALTPDKAVKPANVKTLQVVQQKTAPRKKMPTSNVSPPIAPPPAIAVTPVPGNKAVNLPPKPATKPLANSNAISAKPEDVNKPAVVAKPAQPAIVVHSPKPAAKIVTPPAAEIAPAKPLVPPKDLKAKKQPILSSPAAKPLNLPPAKPTIIVQKPSHAAQPQPVAKPQRIAKPLAANPPQAAKLPAAKPPQAAKPPAKPPVQKGVKPKDPPPPKKGQPCDPQNQDCAPQ
jgi:hypothetical protein